MTGSFRTVPPPPHCCCWIRLCCGCCSGAGAILLSTRRRSRRCFASRLQAGGRTRNREPPTSQPRTRSLQSNARLCVDKHRDEIRRRIDNVSSSLVLHLLLLLPPSCYCSRAPPHAQHGACQRADVSGWRRRWEQSEWMQPEIRRLSSLLTILDVE